MFRWQLIGPVASWDCWPYPEAVRLHQVHPSPEGHQAQVDLACYNQCLLEQSWRTREMIEKGQKNQKNINPSIWSLSQREIFFLNKCKSDIHWHCAHCAHCIELHGHWKPFFEAKVRSWRCRPRFTTGREAQQVSKAMQKAQKAKCMRCNCLSCLS